MPDVSEVDTSSCSIIRIQQKCMKLDTSISQTKALITDILPQGLRGRSDDVADEMQNKLVLEAGERRATNIKKLKGLELGPAGVHGDQILMLSGPFPKTKDSLVAALPATRVFSLSREAAEAALKCSVASCLAQALANPRRESALGKPPVKFSDLEMHRIIGTGQFGMVRVVRHKKSGEVYALKAMFKAPITESKQVEHIVNERRILEEATSEFCVGMVRAFQDRSCLYLLQDLVSGGELFHHLDLEGAFNEKTTLFFAANVLLALDHLHQRGIVYRDLKPENLLVDKNGYLKLADFGFAKKIGSERTYTICGTPDYQAPEVIMRRGTDKAADYWALGILIFEMLTGDPPFKSTSGDPWDTFRKALTGRFFCPDFISQTGQSLIFALLQTAPEKRLGSGPTGAEEIKQHKWFASLDWTALEQKRMTAPMVPTVTDPLDTSNFDEFDNQETPPFPGNGKDKNAHMWDLWDWIEGV